jgi:hypothetical protein
MDRYSVFLKFTLFQHKKLEEQERRGSVFAPNSSSFAIDAGGAPPPSLKQRHRPSMEKMVDVKNKTNAIAGSSKRLDREPDNKLNRQNKNIGFQDRKRKKGKLI